VPDVWRGRSEDKKPGCEGVVEGITVNEYNEVLGMKDVFAIGDVACMQGGDAAYPNGHPQLAQAAIQL
jgi:NADH dehydrogenase